MAQHEIAVVNGVSAYFGGPKMTLSRARSIVKLIPATVDLVAVTEMGADARHVFEQALNERKGTAWSRKGSEGTPTREGLNGIFWNRKVWDFPKDKDHLKGRFWNWILPSRQWTRTLILVRLVEVLSPDDFIWAGAFHLSAVGAPYNRADANKAKLAQVKYLIDKIGTRRTLIAGDFPRTDDDDDLVLLKKNDWDLSGRTDRTPLFALSRGAVKVIDSRVVETGKLLDHDIVVKKFSIGKESA